MRGMSNNDRSPPIFRLEKSLRMPLLMRHKRQNLIDQSFYTVHAHHPRDGGCHTFCLKEGPYSLCEVPPGIASY